MPALMRGEIAGEHAGLVLPAARVQVRDVSFVVRRAVGVGTGGSTPPTVTIDGQNQNITGTVVCAAVGGNTSITIGNPGSAVTALLTSDNPPKVQSVVLGNVNGAKLAYQAGTGQGDASATKNGNSYKITGNAVDMTNPMSPVKKPFEIDVTCS